MGSSMCRFRILIANCARNCARGKGGARLDTVREELPKRRTQGKKIRGVSQYVGHHPCNEESKTSAEFMGRSEREKGGP